jgi:hypothetical protein
MVLLGEWQDHHDHYLAARKSYVSLQNLLLEGGVVPVHYLMRYKMKAVPRHVIQDVDKLETIQLGPVSIHVPQIDCINSDLFNINSSIMSAARVMYLLLLSHACSNNN